MRNNSKKGFSLSEMLIVIAIIAILIVILIPYYFNQIEKSKEATDLSNLRNAVTQVVQAATLENPNAGTGVSYDRVTSCYSITVYSVQEKIKWQTNDNQKTAIVSGAEVSTLYFGQVPKYWIVKCYSKDGEDGKLFIDVPDFNPDEYLNN